MSDAPHEDAQAGSDAGPEAAPSASGPEAGEEAGDERPEGDVVVEAPLSVQGGLEKLEPRLGRGRSVDQTRAGLAWALLGIFGGTVAAVLLIVGLTGADPASEVIDLLKTLVPAETALLGSAVGFYFGTRKGS